MDTVLQDLKYALRTLGRAPGFTVAAVLALALGIGGSSAMFSVLESVVLRPLPAPQPERLARLYEVSQSGYQGPWSALDYLDLEKENGSFEAVAAVHMARVALTADAGPLQLPVARVTGSFFAALGVHPALGRGLSPEEDKEGAPRAIVLTDGLWKREFGGDRRVLGQPVVLDGRSYTVVGVMPASFRFPLLKAAQAIIPAGWTKTDLQGQGRGMHSWAVFGRLKAGTSMKKAQADLDVLGPRIASRLPDHAGQTLRTVPLHDDLVGPVKPLLQALLGAVIVVLLIACANVASMLLARGAARQRELAIRAALGSGRMRIVRQLLTESVVLAVAGGGLGILLAAWSVDALVSLAPRSIPRLDEVRLDGTVLAFAFLVSLGSGVIARADPGAPGEPARPGGRPEERRRCADLAQPRPKRARRRGDRPCAGAGDRAGLMIRTLVRLLDVRTGMTADPAHVFVAEIDLRATGYLRSPTRSSPSSSGCSSAPPRCRARSRRR